MCGEDSIADAGEVVVGLDVLLNGLATVRREQCQSELKAVSHRATSEMGNDGDDEVRIFTYEEPFRSLSCISRHVSPILKSQQRLWSAWYDQTYRLSQSDHHEDDHTKCAGKAQLTLTMASLIMSRVKTRQQPANTIRAVPHRRDNACDQVIVANVPW